ncbi:hypothetical protein EON65_53915, partial [archaeon]
GFHDLVLLDGTVDAQGYAVTLQDCLFPIIHQYIGQHPCIIQQDNAAVHRAHGIADFCHTHPMQVLDWPAHSSDLNIIEHMWRYLKERVRQLPVASRKENLWSKLYVKLYFQ